MGCEMLERSAVKVARSVLRRGHRSNSMSLFDYNCIHLINFRYPYTRARLDSLPTSYVVTAEHPIEAIDPVSSYLTSLLDLILLSIEIFRWWLD
jgi:hypothetical protein